MVVTSGPDCSCRTGSTGPRDDVVYQSETATSPPRSLTTYVSVRDCDLEPLACPTCRADQELHSYIRSGGFLASPQVLSLSRAIRKVAVGKAFPTRGVLHGSPPWPN